MNRSTNYINLLLVENSLTSSYFKNNLTYVDESQIFHSTSETSKLNDVLAAINTKLHTPGESRTKVLLLLEKFLSQCPADVFSEYSAGWFQQCCKWNQRTINDELRILNDLVKKSECNPDSKKQITATVLPRFNEQLTSVNKTQNSAETVTLKLRCMKTLIDCYSSSCGPHKGIFNKYVMYCLKEFQNQKSIIHEAAVCYVALCECGTKVQQGINFKDVWSDKFKQWIATCDKLFDVIYEGFTFISSIPVKRPEYLNKPSDSTLIDLLDINSDLEITPLKRFYELNNKFVLIAELLRAMLLCKFSVSKSFQPNDIFYLISRLLSVTGAKLDERVQTNDITALAANLSEIHERTFDILQALIICAKRNLIPYGEWICKLCLQSLSWTQVSEWTHGTCKPFESLRCKVYSVLSLWLSTSGTCSSVEEFADDLIPLITSDIEFIKPAVKLTANTTPANKRNKRKRGHLVTEMKMQSDSTTICNNASNKKVCAKAHHTLQLMLRSASTRLKWEQHKNIQYIILPLLLEMFDSTSEKQYPLPYSDVNCRLELFKTLSSLVHQPHPNWTAPVSLAMRIMTIGACDCSIEVASFCKSALNQLEVMIHPRCATLYVPNEREEKTSPMRSSDWFPSNIQSNIDLSRHDNVEQQTQPQACLLESRSDSTKTQPLNMNRVDEIRHSKSPNDIPDGNLCTELAEQKTNNAVVEVIQCNGVSVKNLSSKSQQTEMQRSASPAFRTSVANRGEPPTKKSKPLVEEPLDEKVKSMMDDFVDTLE